MDLYRYLPREPETLLSVSDLKKYVRHLYNDEIDEKSIDKNIKRDLKKLDSILTLGSLRRDVYNGNQPDRYGLTSDASIEKISSELALALVMADDYLNQYLPEEIYNKIQGFFKAAEKQLVRDTKLANWKSRIRILPTRYSNINQKKYKNVCIENIYKALLDNESWLKCIYIREYETFENFYVLKPHGIIQYGDKQFLMASKIQDNKKNQLRTFNIQRFSEIELIPSKLLFDVESIDLDFLVKEKEYEMAYFNREIKKIKLCCESYLKDDVGLFNLGENKKIHEINEDYFILDTQCMVTQSLLNWLIEKAYSIQVLEPKDLYEKIQFYIKNAEKNYCNNYGDIILFYNL